MFRRLRKALKAELAAFLANFRSDGLNQQLLMRDVRRALDAGRATEPATAIRLSRHSQHEEDGILLTLFAIIGTTNRYCVELCAGDGMECNTTNLLLHHGWRGLQCDGDGANVHAARRFFRRCRTTRAWPPIVVESWLTAENIEDLLASHAVPPAPDLLSIDVDGIDYWLWRALESFRPRVVVIEFNHLWGAQRAVTVPYDPAFVAEFSQYGSDYAGASLPAMVKLGRQKGYRLVATNEIATNAFFVLDELCDPWLPEIDPASCFEHPRAVFGRTTRLPTVVDRAWQDV